MLIVGFFLLSSSNSYSQVKDNILWQAFGVKKKWNDKWSTTVKPIVRLNKDLSNYQNSSIDFFVDYKASENWTLRLFNRTWFMPEAPDRQFIWFEVFRNDKFGKFKLQNRVKYHWGLDVNDYLEADFMRWRPLLTYLAKGKVKPFVAIEGFYRFDGFNRLFRMRYEAGLNWRIHPNFSYALMYRRQNSVKLEPTNHQNHFVSSFMYFFD